MADIIHEVTIDSDMEKIYKAVTEKKGLASWWTQDTKAEVNVGSTSEFGFMGHQAVFFMKIVELKPFTAVKWKCENGMPEWVGTELSFELKKVESGNMLRFTQSGFKSTDGGYASVNYTWGQYLASLKKYMETGTGDPHTA